MTSAIPRVSLPFGLRSFERSISFDKTILEVNVIDFRDDCSMYLCSGFGSCVVGNRGQLIEYIDCRCDLFHTGQKCEHFVGMPYVVTLLVTTLVSMIIFFFWYSSQRFKKKIHIPQAPYRFADYLDSHQRAERKWLLEQQIGRGSELDSRAGYHDDEKPKKEEKKEETVDYSESREVKKADQVKAKTDAQVAAGKTDSTGTSTGSASGVPNSTGPADSSRLGVPARGQSGGTTGLSEMKELNQANDGGISTRSSTATYKIDLKTVASNTGTLPADAPPDNKNIFKKNQENKKTKK
uniref:EGF-like domain-containing protein n=1 Tax=Caenorhabditis tropicalis TaxID=1561998 RepID=A0A1I7UBV3_9PELO